MISGGRSGHGCGVLTSGSVMVAGGESYPQDVSQVVELYHLVSDSWTLLSPLPGPLTGSPALITAGLRTYLLGGYDEVTRSKTLSASCIE